MYIRKTDEGITRYLGSHYQVYLQSHVVWSPTIQMIMLVLGMLLSVIFYFVKPAQQRPITRPDVNDKIKRSSSSPSSSILYTVLVMFIMLLFPVVVTSVYFFMCSMHAPIYRSSPNAPLEALLKSNDEL